MGIAHLHVGLTTDAILYSEEYSLRNVPITVEKAYYVPQQIPDG